MSCSCKNKNYCKCGGGSNSAGSVEAQVASLQEQLDDLAGAVKFLTCGHPVIVIDDVEDIAAFDALTGWGSGCWVGFAICNGSSYTSPAGDVVATYNYIDRFVVGALGNYNVGDTGGSDDVVLLTANLPSHNHTVTDPGHTHVIVDPGHTHNVTDPGHTHGGSSAPHSHDGTTGAGSPHNHDGVDQPASIQTGGATPDGFCSNDPVTFSGTTFESAHTHPFTTNVASVTVTVAAAFTGIDMDNAFTGISNTPNTTGLTVDNTGSNTAHENRPPYLAVIFVKKIY